MSDCTAIYPAKTIECLRDAGHDGDHAGQDDAGFQVYWSKPNAAYVPASALEEANEALRAANEDTTRITALLTRAFQFTCHDHYIGPCAAEETRGADCTCGLAALVAEVKSTTAALAPKES